MAFSPTALAIAVLMIAASIGAIVARPGTKVAADGRPRESLEIMIPREFGDWRLAPQGVVQVVDPQAKELLDRLYSDVLTRSYVNADGYRVMLSLAYGSDQRGALQAHRPEVCYTAQGFVLEKSEAGSLATAFGEIPVRHIFAVMGARQERITYWFTVGDRAVKGTTHKKIVELIFGLTGRIPDGMLFRASSIDADETRAYQLQERFVIQLLQALTPPERKRLAGLGD
jgi:EpsI family protein